MSESYWIKSPTGERAVVDSAEQRDLWTRLHGWSESAEPADSDLSVLVYMDREDLPGPPAPVAWAAREYWQGTGWKPSAPPEPVNPAFDPALKDVTAREERPATGQGRAKTRTNDSAAPAAPNKEV